MIDITDFDTSKKAERPVRDFPFYDTRLKEIDWKAIVASGEQFNDPYFKPTASSLVDETMMRNNRIQ